MSVLLVAYAAIVVTYRVDAAGESDPSGYLNEARLWSAGHLIVPLPPELSEARIPLGFVPGPQKHTMVPSYPPGVPLQMALLRLVAGEPGPFFLAPLMAVGAVLLMYRLARDLGSSIGCSACGAGLLALCPVFLFHAIQVMSDDVATFWALAAMICAFRAAKNASFAPFAGVCLGAGVLVRPTQILLLPALVIAMELRRRSLVALAFGGLPFAIAQMAISRHLFGHALTTGYGTVMGDLHWRYFPERFTHYGFWLGAILSPLVFPLGLLGLGARATAARTRLALAAWFIPFFLFYCLYKPYETWWYTRFLLPAIPAVILASLFVLRRWPIVIPAIFVLQLSIIWKFDLITYARGERANRVGARLVAERVPPDAIVVAGEESGALYYYTGRLALRFERITPAQFATVNDPVYALAGTWEVDALREHTGADWIVQAGVADLLLLRRYHPPRDVAALRGTAVPHLRPGAAVLPPGGGAPRQVPRQLPRADGCLPLAGRGSRPLDSRRLSR